MQYPILDIPEIVWVPYHFLIVGGVLHSLTRKLRRNAIPSLGYTVNTMG
jgi:hypothetical protein